MLALWVAVGDALPGDRRAVEAAHDLLGTSLDTPMRAIGYTGSPWFLVPFAVGLTLWCVARRAWGALVLVAGAAMVAWLANPGAKRVFTRDRPDVRDFVEPTSRYAFPSGHAVASAAFATVVVLLAWPTRWRWPVFVGAVTYVVLVGLSRLVLGVHFPSDVVAGWGLAVVALTGLATWALAARPPSGPDSSP